MPLPNLARRFQGMPMLSAPAYLAPYLDAVDGAMLKQRTIDRHNVMRETWHLARGGRGVGTIEIEVPISNWRSLPGFGPLSEF